MCTFGSFLAALVFLLAFGAGAGAARADDRFRLELEAAAAWQQRNDFAVPGTMGTRVDLPGADDRPTWTARATAAVPLTEKWWLRGLVAPLRTVTTITPARDVTFQDATFGAGVPLEVEYVFNSYRASIYRRFTTDGGDELRLGLTAKVRDAKIALTSGPLSREETNLGIVPLVYAGATLSPRPALSLDLDVDALGAPQGYAIDATVRAMQSLGSGLHAFAGYRILDGGADVDRVYAFGTFHYVTAGIGYRR